MYSTKHFLYPLLYYSGNPLYGHPDIEDSFVCPDAEKLINTKTLACPLGVPLVSVLTGFHFIQPYTLRLLYIPSGIL